MTEALDFWAECDRQFSSAADNAVHTMLADVDASVVRGVRVLVGQPWRAEYTIPNAGQMDLGQLRQAVLDWTRVRRPGDRNRLTALRQLGAAIELPEFAIAWAKYRSSFVLQAAE